MPCTRSRRGFGTGAETYERSRPSYPPDAVAWLAEHLRLAPGTRVCDLAAGPAISPRLLVPVGPPGRRRSSRWTGCARC